LRMRVSENTLKWLMRFYPPLFLQRIWVKKFYAGFTGVEVKIAKSILNINYNRSIFGGTIFNGVDPFHPILYHEILSRRGYKTTIWVKRAQIEFIKPAYKHLYFKINIPEIEISKICDNLKEFGKVLHPNTIEIHDQSGQLCALVTNEIYIRYLQDR
jgi:hypothetical protein